MSSATRTIKSEPVWRSIDFKQSIIIDRSLLMAVVLLAALGWLMVTSASMDWSQRHFDNVFYISVRHGIFLCIGAAATWIMLRIPLAVWRSVSGLLVVLALVLLVAVLIPGVGREINGSMRWLSLGFMNAQPSEFAKLATVLYMASYLDRRRIEVQSKWSGFMKPLFVLSLLAILLLLEPDFGAVVVLMLSTLGLLFLGGVKAGQFILTAVVVVSSSVAILISQPYRLKRLTGYWEPWNEENVFGSGYQLTQSLIAFGLLGCLVILGLFTFVFLKAMSLGRKAFDEEQFFAAYVAYGVALLIGFQAFINLGVNVGLLPTKGLTLPFISYGGSSLLACCIALGLLLRVHHEMAVRSKGNRS